LRTKHTILTAAHCVTEARYLSIRGISPNELARAKIAVPKNIALDIAAIHFPEPILPERKDIELGIGAILQDVIVLGYPNVPGFTEVLAVEKASISTRMTVTRGSIASQATEIFAKAPLFLITARVRGGFSGGPVINAKGLAVGIVSRQPISDAGGPNDFYAQYDNLGYGIAIPTEEITKFLTACHRNDESAVTFLDTSNIEYRSFPE
jgi:S1-C subfamily serine protease